MKKPHHAKTAVIQCQLGTYLFMQVHGETRKMAEFVYQNLLFDVFLSILQLMVFVMLLTSRYFFHQFFGQFF